MLDEPKPIVQPRMGRVLGCGWGDSPGRLRLAHPDAREARDAGDVTTWTSLHTIGEEGPSTQATWSFRLGRLIAVDLRAAASEPPRSWLAAALPAILRGFSTRPAPVDEGFEQVVEGDTCLRVDRLDATIRLEELGP